MRASASTSARTNWPPLTVADGEEPTAAAGVQGTLGVHVRPDGSRQVTLDDQPLYFWLFDEAVGDATGQNVGGVWFVISAASDAEVLRLGESADLGTVITGPNGMTLYIFTNDTAGESVCYDQCATNWPPLLIADGSTPVAAPGLSAGTLGTTARTDTTMVQVTLDGRPLYYWLFDEVEGDSTGHGVGEVWFALNASGAQHPFTAPTPTAEPEPTATTAPTEAPAATPEAPTTGNAGLGSATGQSPMSLFIVGLGLLALATGFGAMGLARRR